MTEVRTRKKLIEVALPLDAINAASAREKSIRHGHPSTLHLWWARRPLAAARAVIFSQMVDDPSAVPEEFPTEEAQEAERQRLFRILEDLVVWENTTNETVLEAARAELRRSWKRTCADNADDGSQALFDPEKLPAFHDPFAGGGALPLEAQRLGLESYASDLNPVAVLINKAMIEIPPMFAGQPPVNPASRKSEAIFAREWRGAQGIAEDVRYYGQWMLDEAEKRIGHLYPKVEVTAELVRERPDLSQYIGRKLTVIAWLWARTVTSPNPAFARTDVPLASTFMLSTKAGKEAYVEPVIQDGRYRFAVRVGRPKDTERAKRGTKLSRGANFECLMSGAPITGVYIKAEARAGRMGTRLMAIVAEGDQGRLYLEPPLAHVTTARSAKPVWKPTLEISGSTQYLGIKPYGMNRLDQVFTDRQLVVLTTFADLVHEAREVIERDASARGITLDGKRLSDGGSGATGYAESVSIYLAFALSKIANIGSTIASWMSDRGAFRETFARQAMQMTWDFAEANPLAQVGGSFRTAIEKGAMALDAFPTGIASAATQADAASQVLSVNKVVSTDPPYYDNVPYADLSDFFYVWLRRSLGPVFPTLFSTLAVPKAEELVAFAHRHEGKVGAEAFFLEGMTKAMRQLAEQMHPAFPVTIYYAFKQSESETGEGTASTGWETFLEAVIRAGLTTTGTWPIRTEGTGRIRALDSNALASSVVLVCRRRPANALSTTRRDFVAALKSELPQALAHLRSGNIAPVDLAQAAIGPGMAVYTRYDKVLDATGMPLSVRSALVLINQTLDDVLTEYEGDLDSDSRWALAWFEHVGFEAGDFGMAEQLSKSKNTTVRGLVQAGIVESERGTVRLLRPDELPLDWNPTSDPRLSTWEIVHHLIRALDAGGETEAARLVEKFGTNAEIARELAYRLYTICERKNRAKEALSYNGLVQSWPEMLRLARTAHRDESQSTSLFGQED